MWITPGLIDCHTHLVYAGNRAGEFEQRLLGVSYEQIARSGGGIQSTVDATRNASHEALLSSALTRARALSAEGVTTIEIKSGYGLDLDTEARMLGVAREIATHLPLSVRTTYLGLHALPREFAHDRAGFRRARQWPLARGDGRRRPRRCGGCILRVDRLFDAGERTISARGAGAGAADPSACRTTQRHGGHGAGRALRGLVG